MRNILSVVLGVVLVGFTHGCSPGYRYHEVELPGQNVSQELPIGHSSSEVAEEEEIGPLAVGQHARITTTRNKVFEGAVTALSDSITIELEFGVGNEVESEDDRKIRMVSVHLDSVKLAEVAEPGMTTGEKLFTSSVLTGLGIAAVYVGYSLLVGSSFGG